jgi:DNA repair protein RadA/Sms
MAKSKTIFVCENCGSQQPKWAGRCPSCGEWGSLVEEQILKTESKALRGVDVDHSVKRFSEIDTSSFQRISSGFIELDRVLGDGFVEDEVVLITGEPGVGKSTLLMQIARNLAKDLNILYVSGEESASQVAMRAKRLFGESYKNINMDFLGSGSLNAIENAIKKYESKIVIVDSIQTIYDDDLDSLPGGLAQVKAVSSKLVYKAKSQGFILIIVGHINKDGKVAGPKVLEHLVDCVLQFEGQENGQFRILRSLKNRFGSTGEVGIFQMGSEGLGDMDHTESFLTSSALESQIGVAKSIIVEGNRPLVLDIKTLASKSVFPYPKRVAEGVPLNRLQVICAIIENLKLVKFQEDDVYLKTAQAYKLGNYSFVDLSIAISLVSSRKNLSVDPNYIFIGEITLNGSISLPNHYVQFIKEIHRILPNAKIITSADFASSNFKSSKFIKGFGSLGEVVKEVF